MIRVVIFSVLIVLGSLSTGALEVLESTFFPPQFFVGDRVEHVLVVRSDYVQELHVPDSLPSTHIIEFHRIDYSPHPDRDTAELRISFTAFVPGTVSLPPLHLGAETLSGREVLVRSVQTQYGSELQEPRSQLLIPGTILSIWLVSVIVLVIPVLYFVFTQYGADWIRKLISRITAQLPYRRLRLRLRRLSRMVGSCTAREFYIELLTVLRYYFTEKSAVDCMSATTHEISMILYKLTEDPKVIQELQEVFRYGDLVKFAGAQAPEDIRRTHLLMVFRASAVIEEKEADIPGQVMQNVHT